MLKVGINGIGRIGKAILRAALDESGLSVVALNDLNTNPHNIAYSINYDTTYGALQEKFSVDGSTLRRGSNQLQLFCEPSIDAVAWSDLGVDIVIDASGDMRQIAKAHETIKRHNLKALFLTHSPEAVDFTMVLGVNEQQLDPLSHRLISASTCNATAMAPVFDQLERAYGITGGFITTVHPWLSHQKVIDSSCIDSQARNVSCNFEFGRSAVDNIIPTQTTTLSACSRVLPYINDTLLGSLSLRTPTPTVGCIDATLLLQIPTDTSSVIALFREAQRTQRHKVFWNNDEKLVSSDFKGSPYTSIIDHRFTQVRGNMLKLIVWYDNEAGYASKVVAQVLYFANRAYM